MLTKKEVTVMRCIYDACKRNNGSCIISDDFILQSMPEKYKMDEAKLDTILKQLQYDGYFECTKSERKGETVNVISLMSKGKAFKRELIQRRRELIQNFIWRMIFAAMGAVVGFLVSLLLRGIS